MLPALPSSDIFGILYFQDIKAAHIAIEAPIQVLLKLSMISLGILDLPG
jgi:hypothetical protein